MRQTMPAKGKFLCQAKMKLSKGSASAAGIVMIGPYKKIIAYIALALGINVIKESVNV